MTDRSDGTALVGGPVAIAAATSSSQSIVFDPHLVLLLVLLGVLLLYVLLVAVDTVAAYLPAVVPTEESDDGHVDGS